MKTAFPIGAIAALFIFTIRQMLRDAKFWTMVVALFLPCALALLIQHFHPPIKNLEPAWHLYHGLTQFMFLMGLLPLACMIYGTGMIGTEAESKTIGYLITRRLRRRTVLLTKFAATAIVLIVACGVAMAAIYASVVFRLDWPSLAPKSAALAHWAPANELKVYLAVTALGVIGFLAIFSLIGLLTPKPLAMSVLYMIVVELVIGNLPLGARAYSLIHQLRISAAASIPGLPRLFQLPPDLNAQLFPVGGSGLPEVLIASAAALLLACVLVSMKELTPSKVARD